MKTDEYSQYEFLVKLDKVVVFSQMNAIPKGENCDTQWNMRDIDDPASVAVYAGDPWYPAADARIRNLIISPQTNRPSSKYSGVDTF